MVATRSGVPEEIRSWRGAEQLSSQMAAAGFLVPQRYLGWLAGVGGRPEEEFRKECARYSIDLVRGGGFRAELEGGHQELFRLRREITLDAARQDELVEQLLEWKRAEARPDEFLEKGWREGAAHVRVVAQRAARREGFAVTRKGYRIEAGSEFAIDVELDIGDGRSSTIQRISPSTRLLELETGWSMWLPWREVLLGMDLYNYGKESGALVWGIQAYLEVAKIFATTLSS